MNINKQTELKFYDGRIIPLCQHCVVVVVAGSTSATPAGRVMLCHAVLCIHYILYIIVHYYYNT